MKNLVINMSNPPEKYMLLAKIRELLGMHVFSIKKFRKGRTLAQNRYYWPCFIEPFADFLRSQGYGLSDDDAHEILKHRFLKRSLINERGERVEFIRSTSDLDVVEMNQYLDQCAAFIWEYAGHRVPEASIYRMPLEKAA